jgi:hypothetical protein
MSFSGVCIYKNATRAINGPRGNFVFIKMPLNATNGL